MARKKKHGLLGDVNLLGLDEFGQNPGISPITGALIGGGVAAGTAMTLGHIQGGTMAADREFYGLAAGLGAAALLWLSGPSRARHASWGAAVGAILAEGLPWLEKKFLGTVQLPAATAATATAVAAAAGGAAPGVAGMGIPRVHALNGGLGMRRQAGGQYLNGLGVAKVHALNGAGGLGLATIHNQPQSVGTIPGVHGPSFAGTQLGRNPPVSAHLLGGNGKPSLLGTPAVHGLSAAYGATLLGGGR